MSFHFKTVLFANDNTNINLVLSFMTIARTIAFHQHGNHESNVLRITIFTVAIQSKITKFQN